MTDYINLKAHDKEEYLARHTLKYLQKVKQPVSRAQIINYLVKNISDIPNDVLTPIKSKKGNNYVPFKNRLSFGLTSLYKAKLIDHPKRGISELTELGQRTNADDVQHLHELFVKGWKTIK